MSLLRRDLLLFQFGDRLGVLSAGLLIVGFLGQRNFQVILGPFIVPQFEVGDRTPVQGLRVILIFLQNGRGGITRFSKVGVCRLSNLAIGTLFLVTFFKRSSACRPDRSGQK